MTICILLILVCIIGGIYYYFYRNALSFERVYRETRRIKSPDRKVDVVLVESDVGATSSYILDIYVVKAGKKIARKDKPVFSAFSAKGYEISWLKDRFLDIKYEKAKISYFCNYEYPLSEDATYLVEIRQTPIEDSALE